MRRNGLKQQLVQQNQKVKVNKNNLRLTQIDWLHRHNAARLVKRNPNYFARGQDFCRTSRVNIFYHIMQSQMFVFKSKGGDFASGYVLF